MDTLILYLIKVSFLQYIICSLDNDVVIIHQGIGVSGEHDIVLHKPYM